MKKITVLLLLVLACAGCGGKRQRIFTVINQSDWRIVVTLTNFNELGKKIKKANYVIGECNNLRRLPNKASFILYEQGDCNLLSVNGARIKFKTDTLLILENAPFVMVNIVNQTGKDVTIKNEPHLGGTPIDLFYDGTWGAANGNLHTDYRPVFESKVIKKDRTQSNPVIIPMHAWQLFEIIDPQKFTAFANKYILIVSNIPDIHTTWERSGDRFFLYITN